MRACWLADDREQCGQWRANQGGKSLTRYATLASALITCFIPIGTEATRNGAIAPALLFSAYPAPNRASPKAVSRAIRRRDA